MNDRTSKEKVVQPWDLVRDKNIQQLVFTYEMVLTEMRTWSKPKCNSHIKEWVGRIDNARDEFVQAMSDRQADEPKAAHRCASCKDTGVIPGGNGYVDEPCIDCDAYKRETDRLLGRASEPPSVDQKTCAHEWTDVARCLVCELTYDMYEGAAETKPDVQAVCDRASHLGDVTERWRAGETPAALCGHDGFRRCWKCGASLSENDG